MSQGRFPGRENRVLPLHDEPRGGSNMRPPQPQEQYFHDHHQQMPWREAPLPWGMVEGAAGPVGAGGWAGHNRENFPQDRSGRQIWQRGEDRRPGSIGRGGRGGGGASRARQNQQQRRRRSQPQSQNQQQRQQSHSQQQQQQEGQPNLHTTGGRPWTLYSHPAQEGTAKSTSGSDTPNGMEAGQSIGEKVQEKEKGTQITLVSYNVLAGSLVSFNYIPYCRNWSGGAWEARPGRTLEKVLEFQPDVVCLQEVDEDQYKRCYMKSLVSLGYVGTYCKRSGGKKDGCATFVRGDRVRLVQRKDVVYKIQGHPIMDRDNIALLVVVDVLPPGNSTDQDNPVDAGERFAENSLTEQKQGKRRKGIKNKGMAVATPTAKDPETCGSGSSSRKVGAARIVIANTHLLFNPKRGDIKTAQLMMLTESVQRLAESSAADGVIVCGDFNLTPDSALYHYMVKGELNVDGLDRFAVSGQCELTSTSSWEQKKIVDTSGVMPHRVAGVKHQGGGCSTGSFLRPSASTAADRARKGSGRRENTSQQQRPSCKACSNRADHFAASSFVMADDITAAHHSHPGAPPSSFFAVMDPTPCSCTVQQAVKQGGSSSGTGSGGACDGSSSNTGKNDDGGSDVGGDAKNELRISLGEGHETHNPPLLWPGDGNKLAHRREQGPVVHGLRLKSAYAQQADAWGTGEPAFTSYHHMFKGTVDYVFYGTSLASLEKPSDMGKSGKSTDDDPIAEVSLKKSERNVGCLRCLGVAEPPLQSDLNRFNGLPSSEEPSDHILLAVRFEVALPAAVSDT